MKPLDRFLRLFSDVKAGEGLNSLLLALNLFLILVSYYFLKTLREPLIQRGEHGAQVKSYAAAAQALLLLVAVPAYGALASRFPRRKLINTVTLIFVGCMLGFYAAAVTGLSIGVLFYFWVGIFNMMIVAQFWAFANDLYTADEGSRLFPIVAFGASLGAVVGSKLAGLLLAPIGLYQLLLVAAGVLLASVFVANIVDRRERQRTEFELPPAETTAELPAATTAQMRIAAGAELPLEEGSAFRVVFRSRYLILLAALMFLLNWVNTNGEFILSATLKDAYDAAVAAATARGAPAPSKDDFIAAYYASYFTTVNLAGVIIQLFLTSRIIKYFGARRSILVLPIISVGSYALLGLYPVLSAIRWAKIAENSTDYSLNNTVRGMLFLPTTRAEKYKGKQAIDSFFVRMGDVFSAILVFVGTTWLALSTRQYALVNLGLALTWLALAVVVGREYARRAQVGADRV
jgi:AAA family ATP:ADP antiporter